MYSSLKHECRQLSDFTAEVSRVECFRKPMISCSGCPSLLSVSLPTLVLGCLIYARLCQVVETHWLYFQFYLQNEGIKPVQFSL